MGRAGHSICFSRLNQLEIQGWYMHDLMALWSMLEATTVAGSRLMRSGAEFGYAFARHSLKNIFPSGAHI